MNVLGIRLKFIGVSILLCLALAGTIIAAIGTIRAYQKLEEHHQLITAGDVNTISSWMTVPYIARVYHIPESCLDGSLQLSDPSLQKHATLRFIADQDKKPVDDLIHSVQQAILNYRKNHLFCGTPTNNAGPASVHQLPLSPAKGKAA
jgi:hypothetical protein